MPGMEVSYGLQSAGWSEDIDEYAACFSVASGDVEDAPALDPLAKFEIVEKDGAVYIEGEEATIKASRRHPNTKCSISGHEKVVVVGGYGHDTPPLD